MLYIFNSNGYYHFNLFLSGEPNGYIIGMIMGATGLFSAFLLSNNLAKLNWKKRLLLFFSGMFYALGIGGRTQVAPLPIGAILILIIVLLFNGKQRRCS